jgi:regulatory protein
VTTPANDRYQEAMQAALRLLRLRDRTEAELSEALAAKGFGEPELAQVLKTLRVARYVDDARIAERAVELAGRDSKGKALVEASLVKRGTSEEAIDAALEKLADETDLAESAFEKARKPDDTPARAAARLARKGFDEDTIRTIIERHFPEFD